MTATCLLIVLATLALGFAIQGLVHTLWPVKLPSNFYSGE